MAYSSCVPAGVGRPPIVATWEREFHQLRHAGPHLLRCERCGMTTQTARESQVARRMCPARRLLLGGVACPTDWGVALVRLFGWWRGHVLAPGPSVAALLGVRALPAQSPAGQAPAGPSADALHMLAGRLASAAAARPRSRTPRRRSDVATVRRGATALSVRRAGAGPGPSRGVPMSAPASPVTGTSRVRPRQDCSSSDSDGPPRGRGRLALYQRPSLGRGTPRSRSAPRASAAASSSAVAHLLVQVVGTAVCLACGCCVGGRADAVLLSGVGCRGWSPVLPRAALALLRSLAGAASLSALRPRSPAWRAASRRLLLAPDGVG